MTETSILQPWERIAELVALRDAIQLEAYLEILPPAETARAVSRLDEEERMLLLTMLTPEEAADVLRDLPDEQAAELIEEISPAAAAKIVDQLPADEQADLLADVDALDAEAILKEMPLDDARRARALLQYPETTAGGLMTSEYLAYAETITTGEVLADLEKNSEEYAEYQVQYSYIVDTEGRLKGVLRMRDLLLTSRNRRVSGLMLTNPVHVRVDSQLIQLGQLFDEHFFMGVPVVDLQGRLIGIVERTAVLEARGKREKNSFLKISGIVGGEEFRSMPMVLRSVRRLSWLGPNILLNIIAASVIAMYQDTLQAVIALAVFLPIISDMSGCSGNQAVAVSIRELSLGLIKPTEFTRIFAKESALGLINGVVLGILLGGVAYLWKGNIYLGLVVATALAANTMLSVLLGGSVPLFLRKMKVDPALASGPILTTVTDMCGFFLVLSLASAMLEKL